MKRITSVISMVAMGFYLQAVETNTSVNSNTTPTQEEQNITNNTPASTQNQVKFTQEQLDQALAPVALYPDSLLAQLLMASTYPNQVMEASKWSKEHPKMKGDEAVKAVSDKTWDSSVASLVAFPQVLEMMSKNPDWVKSLGDMFLEDPDAVMDTIQKLRRKAKEAGNLKNTKEQKVVINNVSSGSKTVENNNTTIIEIQPANPEVVYIPYYDPMIIYGDWWYPAYPPYYYHPHHLSAVGKIIGFGAAIIATHCLWSHWDWHHHDININIHKHNEINIHKKLDISAKRASWKQNLRVKNPKYTGINRNINKSNIIGSSTKPNDKIRNLKRENIKKELNNKGINLDKERQNLLKNSDKINKKIKKANIQKNALDKSRDFKRDRVTKKMRKSKYINKAVKPTHSLKREIHPVTIKPKVSRPAVPRREIKLPTNISRPMPQLKHISHPPRISKPSVSGLRHR